MKKWIFVLIAILLVLLLASGGCGKKQYYSLTITVIGEGSTTPGPGSSMWKAGDDVTITASPASGWKFDHWSGDALGNIPIVTVRMGSNKNVFASFSK